MSTTTPNYGFVLPTPNSPIDANTWGVLLNAGNFTPIDTYLKTTALSNISNTAPTIPAGAPLAGQAWIDTNSSSTTAWYTKVYDGAQWVTTGTINPTTHTFTASGVGSSGAVNIVTFTSTGTYTPSSGMTKCVIECWGGGGGGAGAGGSSSPGGGGGAGGYSQTLSTSASVGSSQTVTIGAAGTAGAATPTAGGNGGSTSVGSLCVANGGSGCTTGFGNVGAGAVTTSTVGNILTLNGQSGFSGAYPFFNGVTNYWIQGGRGGSTIVGNGGVSPVVSYPSTQDGGAAQGYGSGGGGATNGQSGTARAGGAGAGGLVRITEYFG